MTDAEKDEYIRALGERERELERRFATLERERQEFLAKLSPRRRTEAEAWWAERDGVTLQ